MYSDFKQSKGFNGKGKGKAKIISLVCLAIMGMVLLAVSTPLQAKINDGFPYAVNNTGVTFEEGKIVVINNNKLKYADNESISYNLTYTITQATTHGKLLFGIQDINNGGKFTQADIDANQLYYRHAGDGSSSDSFRFTVSDGVNTTQESVFNLIINASSYKLTKAVSPSAGGTI